MYEVRFFDKTTGKRKGVEAALIGPCSWSVEIAGGFGQFTLPMHARLTELANLAAGDVVEVWDTGIGASPDIFHYRGEIEERGRQEAEPELLELRGFGFMAKAARTSVGRMLRGGDIATLVLKVCELMLDTLGLTGDVVLDIASTTGITSEIYDGRGVSSQQALDDLVNLTGGLWHWGVDRDPATQKSRLYLRETRVSTTHLAPSSPEVSAASGGEDTSQIVNRARIVGDALKLGGNLIKNADFEAVIPSGLISGNDASVAGNLLQNPGFEFGSVVNGGTSVWTLTGGATCKQRGVGGEPDPNTGDWHVETDDTGEGFNQQQTLTMVPGHRYRLLCYARPEVSPGAEGTVQVFWLTSGAPVAASEGTLAVSCFVAAYEQFSKDFVCPVGAVGFRIEVEQFAGSLDWDDFAFYDADDLAQEGWGLVLGDGAAATAYWSEETDSKHGAYHVKVDVSATGTSDTDDVILRPQESSPIKPSGKYVFFVWAKADNPHAGTLDLKFLKSDGTQSGATRRYEFSGTGLPTWDMGFVFATAPRDAVAVLPLIRMRSVGVWRFDALTLADDRELAQYVAAGEAPGQSVDSPYLPDGPLTLELRAEDLVSALEDADVHDSATNWGPRWSDGDLAAPGVASVAVAKALAKAKFLRSGKPERRVEVTLPGGNRPLWVGDGLRLIEPEGVAMAGPVALPIVRIRGSVDDAGLITRTIEAGQEAVTLESLIASTVRSTGFGTPGRSAVPALSIAGS
jgi:hypothetical protein